MVKSFVIGNDTLRKHRMIIDFKSKNLMIKNENVHALDFVVIPPRRQVNIRMAPKTRAIIPGAIGQVCLHDKLSHMGLTSDTAPLTMPIDSTFSCMIYNKSRRPIYIRRNKCIGFRVYANEHDATFTNRTQAKNSPHTPSDDRMENNEQSNEQLANKLLKLVAGVTMILTILVQMKTQVLNRLNLIPMTI